MKGKRKMLLTENEQDKIELTDEILKAVEDVCSYTLEYEGFNQPAEISITFTDNENIQSLNRQHRSIDRATDVLSFPILEFDEDGNIINEDFDFDEDDVVLGDIVISLEKAQEQAESYGHSLKREVAFLTAHSMLHLLGYDHMEEDEEKVMFKKQKEILSHLGIERN